jgi:hypothetical protein
MRPQGIALVQSYYIKVNYILRTIKTSPEDDYPSTSAKYRKDIINYNALQLGMRGRNFRRASRQQYARAVCDQSPHAWKEHLEGGLGRIQEY